MATRAAHFEAERPDEGRNLGGSVILLQTNTNAPRPLASFYCLVYRPPGLGHMDFERVPLEYPSFPRQSSSKLPSSRDLVFWGVTECP